MAAVLIYSSKLRSSPFPLYRPRTQNLLLGAGSEAEETCVECKQAEEKNPAYIAGRRINKGGYAKVSVDPSHPYARSLRGKNYKVIFEHRLVMEKVLGRYLLPGEIVDHIDGLTLHNDPSNLRLFATNADHVRETLKGHCPNWSEEGFGHMKLSPFLRKGVSRIDSYAESKARGEVRLIQILRAALKLGINSPYLLGTHHWLKQAQIDYSSQTKIKRALAVLCP